MGPEMKLQFLASAADTNAAVSNGFPVLLAKPEFLHTAAMFTLERGAGSLCSPLRHRGPCLHGRQRGPGAGLQHHGHDPARGGLLRGEAPTRSKARRSRGSLSDCDPLFLLFLLFLHLQVVANYFAINGSFQVLPAFNTDRFTLRGRRKPSPPTPEKSCKEPDGS